MKDKDKHKEDTTMTRGYNFRDYCLQKRIARKYLERAKSLRGTELYKGAFKRAHVELSHATFIAEAIGIIHR